MMPLREGRGSQLFLTTVCVCVWVCVCVRSLSPQLLKILMMLPNCPDWPWYSPENLLNTDRADSGGYACEIAQYSVNGNYYCGRDDDEGFGANISCCVCGGGLQVSTQAPTPALAYALKGCPEGLVGRLLPWPRAMHFSSVANTSGFSRESCTVSLRLLPPKDFNLIQSLTDPMALKSAVAAAAGLSSVTLAGPVQEGSEVL